MIKLGSWISGLLLGASLLLGTSCERLKKAASGSGSEELEELELGEASVIDVRDPE
ncbi:MAG: hypothetical protein OSA48_06175 [Akkermansiaceae bacterium]|nr:hypothetical protein [Akkermansiaceae bacterium]